ncbi:MAG: hypothetical protein COA42_07130 [Alteromonadaceae bacterium]|nr:MAG: hypothetical protein COA42_07130 [Alteromonadaceae bacterium]
MCHRPSSANACRRLLSRTTFKLLFFILCYLFTTPALSQDQNLRFERLFTDALSQEQQIGDSVIDMLQDQQGFIWLAGRYFLGRYDGERLQVFNAEYASSKLPCFNLITDIAMDKQGIIWISTITGLCRYNPVSERFESIPIISPKDNTKGLHLAAAVVNAITVGPDNSLYVATENGLITHFSPDRQHSEHISINLPGLAPHLLGQPEKMKVIGDTLWVVINANGVIKMDLATRRFSYPKDAKGQDLIIQEPEDIELDEHARLWIATRKQGVFVIQPGVGIVEHHQYEIGNPHSLAGNLVWSITRTADNKLWFSTEKGLSVYEPSSGKFFTQKHNPSNKNSLSSNRAVRTYEDRNGDIWVATNPFAVHFHDRTTEKINTLTHQASSNQTPNNQTSNNNTPNNSLNDSSILTLKASGDRIWIGTEKGLNSFTPETGTVHNHSIDNDIAKPWQLGHYPVISIAEDKDGILWIGTWRFGLFKYNPNTHEWLHTDDSFREAAPKYIWDIKFGQTNKTWLATDTIGLSIYDSHSDQFEPLSHDPTQANSPSSNYLWTILQASDNTLWLGTLKGLDHFDPQSGHYQRMHEKVPSLAPLHQSNVKALYVDDQKRIWGGTTLAGAFMYDPANQQTRFFNLDNGLTSLQVVGITKDLNGDIWLATHDGLARINPQNYQIQHISPHHGLASKTYNRNAIITGPAGRVFAGGTEGLSYFFPEDLKSKKQHLDAKITQLKIDNKTINTSLPESPLTQAIYHTRQLTLPYQHSMMSLHLSSFGFNPTRVKRYRYKLLGYDKDWVDIGTENIATYTNLPAGDYTFQAQAFTRDGHSSQTPDLQIRVLQAPWLSWWAFIIYGTIISAVIRLIIQSQKNKIALQREQSHNAELLRFNDLKDMFLANTSHELRTPLNGMVGIAEALAREAADDDNSEQHRRLKLISSCGMRLASIINDILDRAKMSDCGITLHKRPFSLEALVERVFEIVQPMAQDKGINLEATFAPDCKRVIADEDRMQQVFINLVGNAIKYSDSGTITVSARTIFNTENNATTFEVSIADTGIGIRQEKISRLFTAFDQLDNADPHTTGGTGLGLAVTKQLVELHDGNIHVESIHGQGSNFILRFSTDFLESTKTLESAQPLDSTQHLEPTQSLKPSTAPAPKLACEQEKHVHTIMIADDDPINRMVLKAIIIQSGNKVIEATSGTHVLKQIETPKPEQKIDLFIFDVMMPGLSGFDTCRELRQRTGYSDTPIIFLTAQKGEKEENLCLQSGGNLLLRKPVMTHELVREVDRLIKNTRLYS